MSETDRAEVVSLVRLCQYLGEPSRNLAIMAEGNVGLRSDSGTMIVTATGASLNRIGPSDLVDVRTDALLELLDFDGADDEDVKNTLLTSRVSLESKRPTVEALIHAVLFRYTSASVVAHTHPVGVNALLCSRHAEYLTEGAIFPDQIVVLGPHALMLPYVDPGLGLGRAAREALQLFQGEHGRDPKVIYVRNHGMFALGASCREVQGITEMAEKVAQILVGSISAGGPVFLTPTQVARIDSRPDELLRRLEIVKSEEFQPIDDSEISTFKHVVR